MNRVGFLFNIKNQTNKRLFNQYILLLTIISFLLLDTDRYYKQNSFQIKPKFIKYELFSTFIDIYKKIFDSKKFQKTKRQINKDMHSLNGNKAKF